MGLINQREDHMLIAFQVILLIVILLGAVFIFDKEQDKTTKTNAAALSIAAITAFTLTIMWF
jgi:uncharacterized protein YpmB